MNLEKKEYLVGVKIIEGRNLRGKDAAGTSDPFVKLTCANLPPQVTKTKFETNTAVWNQSFTFSQVMMNQYELETFELLVEVFDYNAVHTNELIGMQSIGLSTLYRNLNHEFYKVWITLFNPKAPNDNQGYLLLSCFIVGPNERPPAHAQDEQEEDEEVVDEDLMKGMSEEQKIAQMKKKQGVYILQEPTLIRKGYSLSVSVLKAEGLPQCDSSGSCNSFVSVRAVGVVQTTRTVENNYSPIYGQRLCFPVYVPILNDKITVRMWSKAGSGSIFIANIPEYPTPNDLYNISKLLSCDGKMRCTWFNLYGVHPNERGWFSSNKSSKKEGSTYLGRVLISMLLTPNDKPQLLSTMAQPAKEPPSANYNLWVDTYDLVNCDEANGKPLWIVATIGHHKTQKHSAKYKSSQKIYTWSKYSMKPLNVNFPRDLKQTPDIIINVYTEKTFSGEYRLGYIRIPAKDCHKKSSNPQWYRLKSPENDKTCPGILLMNVQYVWEGEDTQRFPQQKSVEEGHMFYGQILTGFEIAPNLPVENLNTRVDIKIGNIALQKEGLITDVAKGRHPFWNYYVEREINLNKNLRFAPDMRVTLFNSSKSLIFSSEKKEVIGEFSVPVSSLTNFYKKPQYFNVLNNEGKLQGQVLGRFYVKLKDKKKKRDNQEAIKQEFRSLTEKSHTVNIYVSVFGIRNLIKNAKKPVITLRLTHSTEHEAKKIILKNQINTRNPNFGDRICFENVELYFEPLLWPMLEIVVHDEAAIFGLGGCETCYTTIALFEFVEGILTEEQIKFCKAQLNKNQNKLSIVQKQINPVKYYNKIANQELRDDSIISSTNEDGDNNDDDLGGQGTFRVSMIGGMRIKELDEDDNQDDDSGKNRRKLDSDDSLDADDIRINMTDREEGLGDKAPLVGKKEEMKELKKGGGRKVEAFHQDGVQIDHQNMIDVMCTAKDKQEEDAERQGKVDALQKKLDSIDLEMQWVTSKEKKEKYKQQSLAIRNEIDELNAERMNEHKFWGYVIGEQEEFNYGRDVLREQVYESQLHLPYHEFPLFAPNSSWTSTKTAQVDGMLRSGVLTGATLKAKIKVIDVDEESEESEEEEQEDADEENQPQNVLKVAKPTPGAQKIEDEEEEDLDEGKNEDDKELALIKKISKKFPFDLTNLMYLHKIVHQYDTYKIRLYLLTCQNLSAVDSYVDLKSALAGMQALCTADPFPVIIVGDGKNDTETQKVKYVNERDKYIKQDLNPRFFRTYEFDATFPEDWKIEIQIYDKGRLAYTDALIGATTIDLEDRLHGKLRLQTLTALELAKKKIQDKKNREEKKDRPNKQKLRDWQLEIDDINKKISTINLTEAKPVPVEFRELRHPNKQQAQGIVEMWVEVLTQEEARKMPMSRLQIEQREQYEIRLIVWETRDVPLVNGDSVDIYVKVTFDPTGWAGGDIEDKTDIHYASKDGRGVFNWRFKFDLDTPCQFPRLKFQIYDYGMLGDEAIGESNLNLQKTMNIIAKEGRIEIPKTWLTFQHPNKKDEDRGSVLISMDIIPKAEADGAPVGLGWGDPNINPTLEKPNEGRGMMDKMSGAGLNLGGLKMPKFNMFRNLMIIGGVVGVIILVLIVLMFLK